MIHPSTMRYLSDAHGVSRTLLLSINKRWAVQQGEFVESPITFLAAVIWYLKKYLNGRYCTLRHAIELAQVPCEKLFRILKNEPDLATTIQGFTEVLEHKTYEQLDGQLASARLPLSKLSSPELYYVLTGDDLTLNINDPDSPKVLCLGGDLSRQEALAPVLSVYLERLNRMINRPGQHPCVQMLDEFATVRAKSVLDTVASGREHDIVTFVVIQDVSQLRILYSRDEADSIMNMAGNLICGQVGGETARWVSERFPPTTQYRTSVSVNSTDTSISRSEQSNPAVAPWNIATLSAGQFAGIVADEPGQEMPLKAFHGKVAREEFRGEIMEPPVVGNVSQQEMDERFRKVKREVAELVQNEIRRIMG